MPLRYLDKCTRIHQLFIDIFNTEMTFVFYVFTYHTILYKILTPMRIENKKTVS